MNSKSDMQGPQHDALRDKCSLSSYIFYHFVHLYQQCLNWRHQFNSLTENSESDRSERKLQKSYPREAKEILATSTGK